MAIPGGSATTGAVNEAVPMRLRVLGPVELLRSDGSSVPLGSARVRKLLAVLAIRARAVVSVSALVDAIWDDEPVADSTAALHSLISRLRRLLRETDGAVTVVTQPPGYLLEVDGAAFDAACAGTLLTAARASLTADPAAAIATADRAARLWRGRPYAEFAGHPFALAEIGRLDELYVTLTELRADAALRLGDHDDAVAPLRTLIEEHPLRERPHQLLMLAGYRAGRQAEALELFEQYRSRLADELGLDPSPALSELQGRILRHDPELLVRPDSAAGRHPAASPEPATTNPDPAVSPGPTTAPAETSKSPADPAVGTPLIGRADDLAELHSSLRPGVLVTLIGPGGVGKTSLARQIAGRVAPRFDQGVSFAELAAVSDPAMLPAALATVLDLPLTVGTDLTTALVGYLRNLNLLLVLDNCEHLLTAAGRLADAVHRSCPSLTVLATSRVPLQVPGERLHHVTPLAVESETNGAVALFAARATDQDSSFTVTAANVEDVVQICRRLDGLPLAIELAAARMRAMSPADLLPRLSSRFRVLDAGPIVADRQRSLTTLIDWSYDLLSRDQQILWELLAGFAGGFGLADAERLVGQLTSETGLTDNDVATGIIGLVDHSMLTTTATGTARRYLLLETLRAYARNQLAKRPWAEGIPRSHATMMAAEVDRLMDHAYGAAHLAMIERIDSVFDELRAAFSWAVIHDSDCAATLVGGMIGFLEHRVQPEVVGWANRLLATAAVEHSDHGARVLAVAAAGARFRGDLAEARRLVERGRALARDDELARAWLGYLSIEINLLDGDFDAARTNAAMLAESVQQDLPLLRMAALIPSLISIYRGDGPAAAAELRQLELRASAAGADVVAAWTIYAQGEALLDSDPTRAIELLTEALRRATTFDERYLGGVVLVSLASVRSRHGDPAAAVPLFRDVVQHWHDVADWTHQWVTLRNVVDLLCRLRRYPEAAVLHAALQRPTVPTAFGADAQRLTAARQVISTAITGPDLADLTDRGSAMSDEQVVRFVLDTLDGASISSADRTATG